jgi:hypothetical protein
MLGTIFFLYDLKFFLFKLFFACSTLGISVMNDKTIVYKSGHNYYLSEK